jgi:hypothetical protein
VHYVHCRRKGAGEVPVKGSTMNVAYRDRIAAAALAKASDERLQIERVHLARRVKRIDAEMARRKARASDEFDARRSRPDDLAGLRE